MSSRQEELSELQNYIKEVDKEVTMILQSLQWDRKQLLQSKPKRTCKYDSNHKVPPEKLEEHEAKCALKSQGYADDDIFLPDVLDANSSTVLKLSSENIKDIINYASKTNPVFIRGDANVESEPQTVERLQATYTTDERRAIYDVVIHSRPSCEELADLAVGEAGGASQSQSSRKSKLEQLAEMRDMKRRRAKYRVAVRSRNYSNTLRGVIQAQMEMYAEAQGHTKSKPSDESNIESDKEYRKVKEEHPDKCFDNLTDSKTNHRESHKDRKDTYDDKDRRNKPDNKRKRDYVDDRNTRKFDRDRYQSSAEERRRQYDNYRRHERQRDPYRECNKNRHQSSTEEKSTKHYSDRRQEKNRDSYRIKIEKDEAEDTRWHYNNDSRNSGRNRDTYEKEDSKKHDKSINLYNNRISIKEERDSSSSRDSWTYCESEREERYKDRLSSRYT
ncbi:U11/U12 small nuclear ribonucleoprotein 48 kDa protein-like [Maniola jurtina]|uniref:U11/U12 small nuclear ribonucleoprotein 48 kDa protein-like n=1 Tax=Maniola jurtina TaxID=191418 RepID=UPI001E68DBC1|nr:U11/U12 small nuclear ribonucleoprotein 48 kDa protein-like [Maniola jurtina]